MKIVQINATCGIGSTGKICVGISRLLTEEGIENHILYSCRTTGYPLGLPYSSQFYRKMQVLKSRIFGNYGFNSVGATQKLIATLARLKPDIVHLHNIHENDCNLKMLLGYLKKHKIKVIWTFHDCWAFTAYCPHFTMVKCDKWKTECVKCPLRKNYSWFFDRSRWVYRQKKAATDGLDLTIVTPSKWLAALVGQSFLKDHPIRVINNGIDLSVFSPTDSDFRARIGCENKKLILGVAFGWTDRKGLDVFIDLAKRLDDTYRIVLVGTTDKIDRRLPEHIISVHRTQNQRELAEIYSAADVFVNPTREETLGLVNLEALACGTPVLTFRTGGSPETLDSSCGSVVECDDVDALEKEILRICEENPYTSDACIRKAAEFGESQRYKEYLNLYQTIKR